MFPNFEGKFRYTAIIKKPPFRTPKSDGHPNNGDKNAYRKDSCIEQTIHEQLTHKSIPFIKHKVHFLKYGIGFYLTFQGLRSIFFNLVSSIDFIQK